MRLVSLARSLAFSSTIVGAVVVHAGCPAPAVRSDGPPPTTPRAASSCEGARLALAPDAVVATVGGAPVTASALGGELASAEERALRTYCDAVDDARRQALSNHVNDLLVEQAAKKEGKTPQEFVQSRVASAMTPVPEAELVKFYDDNKSPDAPPFDLVRAQVEQAVQRQRVEGAIAAMLEQLEREGDVVTTLPDVAAPPHVIDIPETTATKGAGASAKVTVVEFADFECPYCSHAAETMRVLAGRYGDRVRFAYRHFPLSFHPNARRAAEFAQCAHEQGRFWEFHDKAYENQRALDETTLRAHVQSLGMDAGKLDECLASERPGRAVAADMAKAQEVGVEGTPSFYVNGRAFRGNPTPEGIAKAIDDALAGS